MSKRAILLLVIAALAAGLGLWASQRHFGTPAVAARPAATSMTLLPNPRVLPAFSLQQSDGTPLTGDELKGHWTLVFLGFTHCPDVCPTTLAQLAAAQKQWASIPAATRPRVLFISADPERDSPELTGQYAHGFHADTLAATAPIPQLETFARSLSLVFMKAPGPSGDPDDYSIDHSAGFALLDPQARMAGVIQPPFDVKAIAADIATLSQAAP
ncbi:MAG TPA: SCO family protein [Thermomonas sp.]|nr:SCO family protein [Thermomonas sp.]